MLARTPEFCADEIGLLCSMHAGTFPGELPARESVASCRLYLPILEDVCRSDPPRGRRLLERIHAIPEEGCFERVPERVQQAVGGITYAMHRALEQHPPR